MWQRDLGAVAALDDPVRASLYRAVREAGRPITREEAAAEAGISRKLAAFHLEKLLSLGLLKATYAHPPGRRGRPGRVPKVYVVGDREFAVSVPSRRYDVLGEVLLDALEHTDDEGKAVRETIAAAARRGDEAGQFIRQEKRLGRVGPERTLAAAAEFLAEAGFEPERPDARTVQLRNCPFRALAQKWPDLVCVINHAYLDALVKGIGSDQVSATLSRPIGLCCVELRAG
jgi:predicted ArsR family transcriptional regulator